MNKCKSCGVEGYSTNYVESDIKVMMTEMNFCFTCAFWEIYARAFENNNSKNAIIVNGDHYIDGCMVAKGTRGFVGHGGHLFKIEMIDGSIIETNNLWNQGIIPTHFRSRITDNAKFIQ